MKKEIRYPKILILGTVPYDEQFTSRSFDSYFSGWPREKLQQIYSHDIVPKKGHCEKLLKITDKNIIKYRLNKTDKLTEEFIYNSLSNQKVNINEFNNNPTENYTFLDNIKIYLGAKQIPLRFIIRKLIWSKSIIRNEEILNWIKKFNPELIFLSFTNDFFLIEMADYYSKKFNIPVVITIGDDYLFNNKFSLSPLYYYYRRKYRKIAKNIINKSSGQIYIGDKIRDDYNEKFNKKGKTVYLTSKINRKPFKNIPTDSPKINYFGNLKLGRYKSLIDIANSLNEINKEYILNIYSNEKDSSIIKSFRKIDNIKFHGSIPYSDVIKKTYKSDLLILVEGFNKNDVKDVRYSVSTKIADSIVSGCNLFAYGDSNTGALNYLKSNNICQTCTNKSNLTHSLREILSNKFLQRDFYESSKDISEKNHRVQYSLGNTLEVFEEALNGK